MEDLVLVKYKDMQTLINEVKTVSTEVSLLRNQEDLKAYSVEETAKKLSLSYNTVRKLISQKKLEAVYLNGEKGKCTIPSLSIRNYLKSIAK